ncbi:type Z 30S ribosomal protein S14 [bacterium]
MAKTSLRHKQKLVPKFSTRKYNRCRRCGRPRAFLRDFGICRICFRQLAHRGEVPGVTKASW